MALALAAMRCASGAAGPSSSLLPSWLASLVQHGAYQQHLAATAPTTWGSQSRTRPYGAVQRVKEASVVPEAILRELRELDASLEASSSLDGRRRASLPLSASSLPAPLPPHTVEPGLPVLEAHVRPLTTVGGTACKWLRRSGRVPGRIHSLPLPAGGAGNGGGSGSGTGSGASELLLHMAEADLNKLVRSFGRNGCTARVLQLNLRSPPPPAPPSGEQSSASTSTSGSGSCAAAVEGEEELLGVVRVKPTRVNLNAVTQRLEGIDLLYCPPERVVVVDVPVRLVNDDLAPGVKKGGWMAMFKRTVRYKALGSAVPPYIEVNVRNLDLDQELLVRDMPIPPGTKLHEKNYNMPVLRCTTDVGKD